MLRGLLFVLITCLRPLRVHFENWLRDHGQRAGDCLSMTLTERRALFIGDSFATPGAAACLQEALNSYGRSIGRSYEVTLAGYPGQGLTHFLPDVRNKIAALKPDTVVHVYPDCDAKQHCSLLKQLVFPTPEPGRQGISARLQAVQADRTIQPGPWRSRLADASRDRVEGGRYQGWPDPRSAPVPRIRRIPQGSRLCLHRLFVGCGTLRSHEPLSRGNQVSRRLRPREVLTRFEPILGPFPPVAVPDSQRWPSERARKSSDGALHVVEGASAAGLI